MKISVIVPNHKRDISKLVKSLPKDVDLIHVNIGLERSAQRNIGIDAAKKSGSDAVLILDSDQSVSPKLISECKVLLKFGYSAIYIPEIIVAKSFFGRIRKFEREFYTGTAIDVPRFVSMKACPYFNEDLHGPEDSDWGHRIKGLRVTSINVLYHHDDISFKDYCKKKAYYTKSMKRYATLWPDCKCLDLKYRCFWVFLEKGKWRKLVRHPILALGILFILTVRGVIYATQK